MVNQEGLKFKTWLFENRRELKLKAFVNIWVKDWLPGHEDVRVKLEIKGKTFEGRGISTDQDSSFLIAGAEAVERAYCEDLGINSNGVALHTDKEKAKLNARCELIERDSFLCHFLTKTPFARVVLPSQFNIDFKAITQKLKKQGVEIVLKRAIYSQPQVVFCMARKIHRPHSFNCVLGLGSSYDIKVALRKAMAECLSNLIWILHHHHRKTESVKEFKSKSHYHSIDHQKIYYGDNSELNLDWIFNGKYSNELLEMDEEIELSTLKARTPILREAPVSVVRAKGENLQNIFYGPTALKKINFNRLEKFTNSKVDKNRINWMPHPIG